jgi:hypothetical protein
MAAPSASKHRTNPPVPDESPQRPRIDPDEVLEDLDIRRDDSTSTGSALSDVLSPAGTREDDDRDRTGFVKPHRFQHT